MMIVLVHNYVLHEVLANEPASLLVTLADLAVVPRLTGDLARRLTGRDDATNFSVGPQMRGLFVTRLVRGRGIRDTRIVRDALVADLAERDPERLSRQHQRAAQWFEQDGDVCAALDHWLRARQSTEALRLLSAEHADALLPRSS